MSRLTLLHVGSLDPHPANLRENLGDLTDLTASIRTHGILQPLIVAPHPTEARHYQVIAGHRRLAAAKLAQLNEVPVIIRRAVISTPTAIQIMLIENCQRADLNPMEKALAMGKLRESGMSGRSIARAVGVSEAVVSMHLTLLHLDEAGRQRLRSGDLGLHDAARLARDVRASSRRPKGERKGSGERSGWEPLHFTNAHPLAHTARTKCNEAGHSMRGRLGKVACGSCWENAIRGDERGEPREPQPAPLIKGSREWKARHAEYERDRRARLRAEAGGGGAGTCQVA